MKSGRKAFANSRDVDAHRTYDTKDQFREYLNFLLHISYMELDVN